MERLKKIAVYRKLGLSINEIKEILADETGSALQKIALKKELSLHKEQVKKAILEKLSCGKSYDEINLELKILDQKANITEKLLEAFPGYYGRFICLHFERFLNEPITTDEQQSAYNQIITFLDDVPSFEFPEDLQKYIIENTKHLDSEAIGTMIDNTKYSIENLDEFLTENKDWLHEYLEYKKSEEYKNSPLCKFQDFILEFNSTSGYYDIFIPAMKKLSSTYAKYHKQIEITNEELLIRYPEIARLNS